MIKILKAYLMNLDGVTAAVTYAFSANTLAVAAQVNQNFQDLIAVINALTSVNYADDSVTAAKLNGDVVRATYGLIQHSDGSLYVDVSDTNPSLELTDGGLRVKCATETIGRTSDGLKIVVASQAQGDILYYNGTAWVRLGAGTSGQFLKTQGAASNPTWATIPFTNFRVEMKCSQASSTNITVSPGYLEVNGSLITKTTATTLVLTTAGDWAGGVSLQAVSTYGYIGVDASGNIKMHTTAPSHFEYGVSTTAGKKRYVTWSGTVYRVIGWFYMNATGSGELYAFEVGNIAELGVTNSVINTQTGISVNDTALGGDADATLVHFYSSGGPVEVTAYAVTTTSGGANDMAIGIHDGSAIAETLRNVNVAATLNHGPMTFHKETYAQGTVSIKAQLYTGSNTHTLTCTVAITENP